MYPQQQYTKTTKVTSNYWWWRMARHQAADQLGMTWDFFDRQNQERKSRWHSSLHTTCYEIFKEIFMPRRNPKSGRSTCTCAQECVEEAKKTTNAQIMRQRTKSWEI